MSELNGQTLKPDSFTIEPWTCFRHGAWKHKQPELGGCFFCHFLKERISLFDDANPSTNCTHAGAFVHGLP